MATYLKTEAGLLQETIVNADTVNLYTRAQVDLKLADANAFKADNVAEGVLLDAKVVVAQALVDKAIELGVV